MGGAGGVGDGWDIEGGMTCGTSMLKVNKLKKTLFLLSSTLPSRSFIKFWFSEECIILLRRSQAEMGTLEVDGDVE